MMSGHARKWILNRRVVERTYGWPKIAAAAAVNRKTIRKHRGKFINQPPISTWYNLQIMHSLDLNQSVWISNTFYN